MREKLAKVKRILRGKGFVKGGYYIVHKIVKLSYFYIMPKLAKVLAGKVKENIILFDSPTYSDNGKMLAEYIAKTRTGKFKIIYLIDKISEKSEYKDITFVKRIYTAGNIYKYIYSLKVFYYGFKAKYVFYTHSLSTVKNKNPEQLIINLWHGNGYKDDKGMKNYLFDYMLVSGKLFIGSKSKFFLSETDKILPLGYSRYDLFQTDTKEKSNKFINGQYGKVIIWLPTFTDDDDLLEYGNPLPYIFAGMPLIENLDDALNLDEFCGESNILLIIKKHRLRYGNVPLNKYAEGFKNIRLLSSDEFNGSGIDLYELLPHTDALITDFSSVSVDYLLLDKPIAYTVADIDDYAKTRGFVFDNPLEYMPGAHVRSLQELKEFMRDVILGIDGLAEKRKSMMPLMHNETENYSERILQYFGL